MEKRSSRAGLEDRWHRPARKGEQVSYPADQSAGPCWCMDARHGEPGTLVCTVRHGTGRRWLARWVDHDGQERTASFDRKAEAARKVSEMATALGSGTYADPRRSAETFGKLAEAWIQTKATKAPKTVAGYRGLLDVVILPKWKDTPLREINHEHLQTWFTWLSTNPAARQHAKRDANGDTVQTGLSPARVIQTHNVVHQVLAYAVRCKYLPANPASDIELPAKAEGKDLALTHEQMRALAYAMVKAEKTIRHRSDTAPARTSPRALATMVLLLGYGGLRFGEAIALRVGKVDLAHKRILVDRSITQVRGQGWVEGDTKTHQKRVAPILTTELADALKLVIEGRDPFEYVFPGPDGKAMTIGWFNARFSKAVESLGVEGVTPHTLRHTAGSLALSEGATVVTVQKLLGHRNATTTMNVYSHMLPDDFDKLAAAMDKATAG